jgi:hypothetical protein
MLLLLALLGACRPATVSLDKPCADTACDSGIVDTAADSADTDTDNSASPHGGPHDSVMIRNWLLCTSHYFLRASEERFNSLLDK